MIEMVPANSPTVSIGMPVYNGEFSVKRAIDSLLLQTHTDFELIISDNSSSDLTSQFCEDYAKRDKRIRYIRQSINLGAIENFKFVLDKAQGEFFMWAAADDYWQKEFIEVCLSELNRNTSAFACITNVLRSGILFSKDRTGISELKGSISSRLIHFVKRPGANSRFYSLFRTKPLRKTFTPYNYLAGDWSNIVDFIQNGDFITLTDHKSFDKSQGGAGSITTRFATCRKKKIEFFIPYYDFSHKVIGTNKSPIILFYLLRLNCFANAIRLISFFKQIYTKLTSIN